LYGILQSEREEGPRFPPPSGYLKRAKGSNRSLASNFFSGGCGKQGTGRKGVGVGWGSRNAQKKKVFLRDCWLNHSAKNVNLWLSRCVSSEDGVGGVCTFVRSFLYGYMPPPSLFFKISKDIGNSVSIFIYPSNKVHNTRPISSLVGEELVVCPH